ncbi:MAG: hypothetical protein IPM32_09510 [Ignavibacteriae bacterium]|nr:hypothetical protein [Ignavibacteriota bacterium]
MLKNFDNKFSFNNFIEESLDYILILPLNDNDFNNSLDVAKYFQIHKKNVTLYLPEHRKNLVRLPNNFNAITYSFDNLTKLGLPNKQLKEKIDNQKFDVLVDLEREENLFLVSSVTLINAKFKVGFKKYNVENLYNFQLVNTEINSEISYRNLLNSLKMF